MLIKYVDKWWLLTNTIGRCIFVPSFFVLLALHGTTYLKGLNIPNYQQNRPNGHKNTK
jgi:glutathione peroxidase-family protein